MPDEFADEHSINDIVPSSMQLAADHKMNVGETVFMTVKGAQGEAFVVTDQRVMILREQMPILGNEAAIDCFDYAYEQIRTVMVEDAVGGGHLKLQLLSPPADDKQSIIYFPSYELTKFEAVAARIRLLIEQTRGIALNQIPEASSVMATSRLCAACGAVGGARDNFCAQCGIPYSDICRICHSALPADAKFCSGCGVSSASRRTLICGCGQTLAPGFIYCPKCGQIQGSRCQHCGAPSMAEWSKCPSCGRGLEVTSTTQTWAPVVQQDRASEIAKAQAGTAAEHNNIGMRLYNEERYREALMEFEQAVQLDNSVPLYHCNLGVVYAELDRDDEALEQYEEAIRIAPKDPTAYLNLGYFHSERERNEQAKQAWNMVVNLAPGTPEAQEAQDNLQHIDEV